MKTPTPKGDDTFSKNSRGEVLQKTKIQSTAASSLRKLFWVLASVTGWDLPYLLVVCLAVEPQTPFFLI